MTITTEYNIQDHVRIKELNRSGVCTGFFIDGDGLQYRIRYFEAAAPQNVYFFAQELEPAATKPAPGFVP
jgi:hypothetical protein